MNLDRLLLTLIIAAVSISPVFAQDRSNGFIILHRASVPEAPNLELVMGVLERGEKSVSSKHYHPGGEFGFVIEGTVTMQTEDHGTVVLEEGSSFYQEPGKWHVISTSGAGAKTILVRLLKTGDPIIVEVQ